MAGVLIPGELYTPQNVDEIQQDILRVIELESAKFGVTPDVGPKGDDWIWARGMASCAFLLFGQAARLDKSLTPLDAEGDDLLAWKDALELPDVEPSGASGKIRVQVTGSATIPDGRLIRILESNVRGHVVGTWTDVTDGDEIDVITDDTGESTNTDGGSEVEFINPPANVDGQAFVSNDEPLTGGVGRETEGRLRERVLNRLGFVPGSGNTGHLRDIAFNSSPAVTQCYVYSVLGGPSSEKVVPVRSFDRARNVYTRTFSTAALDLIRQAIQSQSPISNQVVVQAAANESTNVAIQIEIPNAITAGGNGSGWFDPDPWPSLVGGQTNCPVSVVTDSTSIRIDSDDSTPVANQTHFMWWSPTTKKFLGPFLIKTVSGSAGAWDVTVDKPMVDETGASVAAGDFISPAAVNMKGYGDTVLTGFESLGPGENTADSDILQSGRALRRPLVSESNKASLTSVFLQALHNGHPEITDASYAHRSVSTPTVPASVDDAPNVLLINHLAFYPI